MAAGGGDEEEEEEETMDKGEAEPSETQTDASMSKRPPRIGVDEMTFSAAGETEEEGTVEGVREGDEDSFKQS